MGFENCKMEFGKKMNWEMGLVPPIQDPQICFGILWQLF